MPYVVHAAYQSSTAPMKPVKLLINKQLLCLPTRLALLWITFLLKPLNHFAKKDRLARALDRATAKSAAPVTALVPPSSYCW